MKPGTSQHSETWEKRARLTWTVRFAGILFRLLSENRQLNRFLDKSTGYLEGQCLGSAQIDPQGVQESYKAMQARQAFVPSPGTLEAVPGAASPSLLSINT